MLFRSVRTIGGRKMDFEAYKKALLTEAVDNQGIQDVLEKFYHSEIPHVF